MINIAQIDIAQPLINYGLPGVMILWFMLRAETRLKGNENATNRMTRAVLLLVVSLKSANESAKTEARSILGELENEESKKRSDS